MEGDAGIDYGVREYPISIHALRVEGDQSSVPAIMLKHNFYPRPPGGGRHKFINVKASKTFISIHALRVEGDGEEIKAWLAGFNISIHALRVEGDTLPQSPRSSTRSISIHALRVEGDWPLCRRPLRCAISIHALRVEGDTSQLKA